MRRRGVSFVELTIYLFIFLLLNFFTFSTYTKHINKSKLDKEILVITSIFKKYQKYSKMNEKEVDIYFDLEKKNIYFSNYKLELNKSFKYISKNKDKNLKFKRRINKNGNLSKGFTLVIFDDKLNKLAEISFNPVNAMTYPVITIRKEK